MDKITFMGIIVAVMLVLVTIQTVQLMGIGSKLSATGQVVATGGGIDMTGWTADEKMQYEHHGVLPARLQQGGAQQQVKQSGVGGC